MLTPTDLELGATPQGLRTQAIPAEQIKPNPHQPRTRFEQSAIQELAASIHEHGLLQPIVVRPTGESRYEIIAGERRFRACKLLGLRQVPAIVQAASPQATLQLSLVENLQRADISAIEAARAYQRLGREFGLTQDEVASTVGKSRSAVSNTLRLLALPAEMQAAIEGGQISEGHGRALLACGSAAHQRQLFARILEDGLSVRQAEQTARISSTTRTSGTKPAAGSADDQWLVGELERVLGSSVRLSRRGKGGRLSIEFGSEQELEELLHALGFRP